MIYKMTGKSSNNGKPRFRLCFYTYLKGLKCLENINGLEINKLKEFNEVPCPKKQTQPTRKILYDHFTLTYLKKLNSQCHFCAKVDKKYFHSISEIKTLRNLMPLPQQILKKRISIKPTHFQNTQAGPALMQS